jgi:hypothetical protein
MGLDQIAWQVVQVLVISPGAPQAGSLTMTQAPY